MSMARLYAHFGIEHPGYCIVFPNPRTDDLFGISIITCQWDYELCRFSFTAKSINCVLEEINDSILSVLPSRDDCHSAAERFINGEFEHVSKFIFKLWLDACFDDQYEAVEQLSRAHAIFLKVKQRDAAEELVIKVIGWGEEEEGAEEEEEGAKEEEEGANEGANKGNQELQCRMRFTPASTQKMSSSTWTLKPNTTLNTPSQLPHHRTNLRPARRGRAGGIKDNGQLHVFVHQFEYNSLTTVVRVRLSVESLREEFIHDQGGIMAAGWYHSAEDNSDEGSEENRIAQMRVVKSTG
ncbi:hypothetical protein EMCRGX_G018511 [Ephydatia muelleri]